MPSVDIETSTQAPPKNPPRGVNTKKNFAMRKARKLAKRGIISPKALAKMGTED